MTVKMALIKTLSGAVTRDAGMARELPNVEVTEGELFFVAGGGAAADA